MKYLRKHILFILPVLLALACGVAGGVDPTPTVPPPAAVVPSAPQESPVERQADCLIGTWQVADLSNVVLAALPAETIDEYDLEYKSSSGALYASFNSNGNATLEAADYAMEFTAKVSVLSIPVVVAVDGSSTGTYRLDDGVLTTENFNAGAFTASAQAAGQDLMQSSEIVAAFPLIQAPNNTADYTCSGDSLFLDIRSYPSSIPPLMLTRVE